MKSKNIFLYSTLGVLLVFTIFYFVAANKLSYAFNYDEDKARYESKINSIIDVAKIYASNNPDIFEDKDTIYLTVSDLVEKHALDADDAEGNVKDPTSEVKTLNGLKIRISHQDDKYDAVILYD